MDRISPYAKAWAAALAVIVLWVIQGVSTGSWEQTDTFQAAVTTAILGAVVYFVPNDDR